jgi:hypothetical protein
MTRKKMMVAVAFFTILSGSVLVVKSAKAGADGTQLVKVCTLTDDAGTVISMGNTCETGQSPCIANACPSISKD